MCWDGQVPVNVVFVEVHQVISHMKRHRFCTKFTFVNVMLHMLTQNLALVCMLPHFHEDLRLVIETINVLLKTLPCEVSAWWARLGRGVNQVLEVCKTLQQRPSFDVRKQWMLIAVEAFKNPNVTYTYFENVEACRRRILEAVDHACCNCGSQDRSGKDQAHGQIYFCWADPPPSWRNQHSIAQSKAQHNTTAQQSRAEHSTAEHSRAECSGAQQKQRRAQQSTAEQRKAQHSTARHSTAEQNRGEESTTQHTRVTHIVAQHSKAKHKTAQCEQSTAQHSTEP
jgi:hypothetical protein